MKYILFLLVIFTTMLLINTFLFIKITDFKRFRLSDKSKIKLSDKISITLKRAGMSKEIFILHHFLIMIIIMLIVVYALINQSINLRLILLAYLYGSILYMTIMMKKRRYIELVKSDIEKIMRVSYFLETTGTEEKEIYRHLSESVIGPTNDYLQEISSSFILTVDKVDILEKMKHDFYDIQEAVAYANISIQKITTGRSEKLLKRQLKHIKKMKHEKYKRKRRKNRLYLIFRSFLLAMSNLSIVVYPMIKDTLNGLSNILY